MSLPPPLPEPPPPAPALLDPVGPVLSQACSALGDAQSLQQVQDVVRRVARHLVRASGATFVLRGGDQCYYVDEDAIGPLWKGQRFPLEQCISGWAMLHRRPAVIPDVLVDPRIPHSAYAPTFVRSLVMVPIGTDDPPLGAIGAYWAYAHTAADEDVLRLTRLAEAAACALRRVLADGDAPATIPTGIPRLTAVGLPARPSAAPGAPGAPGAPDAPS